MLKTVNHYTIKLKKIFSLLYIYESGLNEIEDKMIIEKILRILFTRMTDKILFMNNYKY